MWVKGRVVYTNTSLYLHLVLGTSQCLDSWDLWGVLPSLPPKTALRPELQPQLHPTPFACPPLRPFPSTAFWYQVTK